MSGSERVILSFADRETENLFYSGGSKKFGNFARVARRKLIEMDNAEVLRDLEKPPGNRLKKLSGDLAGYYSIRINDQWRILFIWTDEGPEEVHIKDYH